MFRTVAGRLALAAASAITATLVSHVVDRALQRREDRRTLTSTARRGISGPLEFPAE